MTAAVPHLAVITNDYPPRPGGIQQYLGNLVDAYPGDVTVLGPADEPATGTMRGEQVVRRNRARFMWPTPAVADWIRRRLIEVAPGAVLFGAPHPLTALVPHVRSVVEGPVGVLCHGAEITIPAAVPVVRQTLRKWLRTADVRFAVSRYTAGRVERMTGVDVHYLGGGVDTERFVPVARTQRAGLPVVGCVSRFVPRKGQERLLEAVALLRERGLDCRATLVGRGRTEERLRRSATRLGLDVTFAVDVPWDDLPQWYASFDVFAMPCCSRWGGLEVEGLGLVFLEAGASGLPVVAGRSGGAPETVAPGRTGYLAESAVEVADALQLLLTDVRRATEMGVAGRRRVEEEFTWDRVVQRLVDGFDAA